VYWLRWHCRVKDIAGATYKIKQKRTEAPTVSSRGQTTGILCSTITIAYSHCQTTTGKVQSSARDGTSSATVLSWQMAGCSTHVPKPLGRHGRQRVCQLCVRVATCYYFEYRLLFHGYLENYAFSLLRCIPSKRATSNGGRYCLGFTLIDAVFDKICAENDSSHFRPSNLDLWPCDLKKMFCQLLLTWATSS